MSQTVALKVGMSCQGCAGAVRRVLGKMEGVESYDIDMQQQKVTVIGNVEPEAVFQTVSKTGKKTAFWEEPASASAETEPKPEEEEEEEAAAAAAAATPDQARSNPTEAELKLTEAAESKPAEAAESKPAEAAPPAA